ncbi:MAG: signal peptidase I [Gemmatimonadetes bacterium]|nr:signal peptidase I [Gemmatimonadota bacterium]MBT8405538.1 signal peptidase I [Gemmatimonadota bacterium]NNK63852.1 signal peptidase I [Gemmatimonadota bacterium]
MVERPEVRFFDRDDEPSGVESPVRRALRRESPSVFRTIWDWTRSVALALVLFMVVRALVVEAFKIPTGSMEGTLLIGDFLLVNKAVYGAEIPGTGLHLPAFAEPHRGDVVVFNPPHEPTKNYVKRLVGEPGDTLEMRDKRLFVNGAAVEEPYVRIVDPSGDAMHSDMKRWQVEHVIAAPTSYAPSRDTWGPIVLPDSAYFVLGDNRDNSEDSRYWGFVDRDDIRGRPWFVYYSFDPGEDGGLPWLRAVRWDRIGYRIR